jgi:O-antigen ligase
MFKFICENKTLAIIFISWSFLWISIGILPQNLNIKINTYVDLINYLRVYLPVFFTFILTFIVFIKFSKFLNYYKKKLFTIINLFTIYFLFQIIGLYQNSLAEFNIQNLYLVILALCTIKILIICQFLNDHRNLEYLLYFALFFCILSSTFFFFFNFIDHQYYTLKDIFEIKIRAYLDRNVNAKLFLENTIPRSTGISRLFGLINIFIFLYLIFTKKKNNYLIYFISIIYTSLIWNSDSRGSILLFFITTILVVYLAKNVSLKKKILIAFFLLFLPIILSETISLLGKNFITSKSFSINENIINQLSKIRIFNDQTSSGRIDIWENSLKIYQKDKLFGYGPQGDRFLLKNSDIKEQFFTNSSNALIYSLLSGGYFGISVMLLIYLNIIFKVYICLKKLKIFNDFNKITLKLSICYTIFFLIRSLFENSFSVFSIDFMIFILSATYIENYLKTSGYKFKVLK